MFGLKVAPVVAVQDSGSRKRSVNSDIEGAAFDIYNVKRVPLHKVPSKTHRVDYSNLFDFFYKKTREAHDAYLDQLIIPELHVSFGNPRYERFQHEGDRLLRDAKRAYEMFDITLTPQQRLMCIAALKTALPKIYGDSWEAEKLRVMHENGWTSFRPELFVVTPRRFGKTTAIGVHCVALIVTIPKYKLVLFAVRLRQSRMLLGMIIGMLIGHPMFKKNDLKIITQNKDKLEAMWPNGQVSEIDAYPSSTDVRFSFFFSLSLFCLVLQIRYGWYVLCYCCYCYIYL